MPEEKSHQNNHKSVSIYTYMSTVLSNMYFVLFIVYEVKAILFCVYSKQITTAGIDAVAGTEKIGDYMNGYTSAAGMFGSFFGAMSGIAGFLFAIILGTVCTVFCAMTVTSYILIKKKKYVVDAWMKIVVYSLNVAACIFFLQDMVSTLMMAVPLLMAVMVLIESRISRGCAS